MANRPQIVLPLPQRRFICGHWSVHFPNPASQPIHDAASGLTYPHACEGCMGTQSEEREAEVVARYAPEKEALANRIEQLRRIRPQPLLSEVDVQRLLAEYELFALKIWEEEEIQKAWKVYNELW